MVHILWSKEPQTREMRQTLEDRFFFWDVTVQPLERHVIIC